MDVIGEKERPDLATEASQYKVALQEGEAVVEIIHKHISLLAIPAVLFLGALSVFIIVLIVAAAAQISVQGYIILTLILSVPYLTALAYVVGRIYSYMQSALILTNQRVINVGFTATLTREVINTPIYEIYNVEALKKRPLSNLLNYGDIELSLNDASTVCIQAVPAPDIVVEQITQLTRGHLLPPR